MIPAMEDTIDVSIIIVNWNSRDHLIRCLQSVPEAAGGCVYEVIVVDNASSDGSISAVKDTTSAVVTVGNSLNRGFAGGVNDGIRVSKGMYLLILNPDIVLTPGLLPVLVKSFEGNADTGVLMPRMLDASGKPARGYIRRIPSIVQVLLFNTILEPWSSRVPLLVQRYLESSVDSSPGLVEVEQIPGACMFTSRDVLDRVGEFDESYGLFYEDVDWSYRVSRQGLKLVLTHDGQVTHAGGGSFEKANHAWLSSRLWVSLIMFFEKHRPWWQTLTVSVVMVSNSLLVVVLRTLQLLVGRKTPAIGFSRTRHGLFLRMFYHACILKRHIPLDPV